MQIELQPLEGVQSASRQFIPAQWRVAGNFGEYAQKRARSSLYAPLEQQRFSVKC